MYRFLRGKVGLGAGECPAGYSFDGVQCQPDSYDCTTSSGQRGKTNASGGCDYILQPAPLVSAKPSTSTPVSTSQGGAPAGAPANYLQPCKTPSGLPGVIGYFGECFYQGAGDPCGNGGIYDALGNCINEKAAPVVTKPVDLPANVPMSKADRDAECRKYYGSNSGAVFHNGVWSCNVCDKDEVLDPSDNLCMCKSGTVRKTPGDTMSPCVPKVNLQPVEQAGFDLKPLAVAAAGILAAVLIYNSFKKEEPS
jgi:hypothetical protein